MELALDVLQVVSPVPDTVQAVVSNVLKDMFYKELNVLSLVKILISLFKVLLVNLTVNNV